MTLSPALVIAQNQKAYPGSCTRILWTVWPDWSLGNFLKTLATINLPKSSTFLSNFCKGVKIFNFSSEIIFGQLLWNLAIFSGHTGGIRMRLQQRMDGCSIDLSIVRSFKSCDDNSSTRHVDSWDHWPILYTFYNRKFWHQSHNFCNYVVILTLEW